MISNGKFAYSITGEHYTGSYSTRNEALAEAMEAARKAIDTPQTVFVGRRVSPNPRASGHARDVIASMTERARGEFGDAGGGYLKRVSKQQITALDQALEQTILDWLQKNNLMPSASKMEAIGEYPLPRGVAERSNFEQREVHEIGTE